MTVDQAEVARIAAMPSTLARNRLVTQAYHDLGDAVAVVVGGRGANWFHFATWASDSVGQVMSGEALPPLLRRLLVGNGDELGEGRHRSRLVDRLEDAAAQVASQLGAGNGLVFGEIGPAGAAFVAAHTAPSAAARDAARAELTCLVTSAAPALGQPRLESAFRCYQDAIGETDPSRHDQLVLAGSLELAAQEQDRLQPYLGAMLDAGVTEAFQPIAAALDRTAIGRWPTVDRLGHRLAAAADRAWDREMTKHVMVLTWPGERIRLGRDVPPYPGQPLVAPPFTRPTEPELVAVFAEFDRTGGTGRGDASRDWADLASRMDWLCWFFLSRQFDPRLWQAPFTPGQEGGSPA